MGHIGLTPQSVNQFGGFRVQGRNDADAANLRRQAHTLEDLGCFSIVLECVPANLATGITAELRSPPSASGRAPAPMDRCSCCKISGAWTQAMSPRFVRRYLDGERVLTDALNRYDADVKAGALSRVQESYS